MENYEQFKELMGILRGILSVQSRHNDAIAGIHKSYSDLLNALAGKAGTEDPPARTASQTEALRKAAAEIAELERMFRDSENTKGEKS